MSNYEYIQLANYKIIQSSTTGKYMVMFDDLVHLEYDTNIIININRLFSSSNTSTALYDFFSIINNTSSTTEQKQTALSDINNIFEFGTDMFFSTKAATLYNITDTANILDYYKNTKYDVDYSKFVNLSTSKEVSFANIEYLIENNYIKGFNYTKDELDNFYMTFCKVILDNTQFLVTGADTTNSIYKATLEYYKNGSTDSTLTNMALILGTLYSTQTTYSSTCTCNSSATSTTVSPSCVSLYKSALLEYLKSMLGNIDFYCDWFTIDTNTTKKTPNVPLIDALKLLIDEFIALGYDLSFVTKKNDCDCTVSNTDASECNYAIISNYKNVLSYVRDNMIDENKNKIKIYGEQFGELLPKLIF